MVFMVPGQMQFEVLHDEMKAHLAKRAEHHAERARYWSQRAESEGKRLEQQLETASTVTDRLSVKNTSEYVSATHAFDEARRNASAHTSKQKFFQFCSEHLPEGTKLYALSTGSLRELELVE